VLEISEITTFAVIFELLQNNNNNNNNNNKKNNNKTRTTTKTATTKYKHQQGTVERHLE
jgi:hypothetical protein